MAARMATRRLSVSTKPLPAARYTALPSDDRATPYSSCPSSMFDEEALTSTVSLTGKAPFAAGPSAAAGPSGPGMSGAAGSGYPPQPSGVIPALWSHPLVSRALAELGRLPLPSLRSYHHRLSRALPPPFGVPWKPPSATSLPLDRRRQLALLLYAIPTCLAFFALCAVLNVPMLGFARSMWGGHRQEKVYDREVAWRGMGFTAADVGAAATLPGSFVLSRLGYSLSRGGGGSGPPRGGRVMVADPEEPLPPLLHVIPPGKERFGYLQYLSIASGTRHLKPQTVYAHMIQGTTPKTGTNFWWDETVKLPGFTVREVPNVKEVWGRPVSDASHRADVLRLRALREFGGVYQDTDVVIVRPFGALVSGSEEVVMGVEKARDSEGAEQEAEIEGLCNAVIVAKKGAKFLDRWWEEYKTFNGSGFRNGGSWNYHSVQVPWRLAKNATANGTPITVLDHRAFFWPLWDDPSLRSIHGTVPPRSPDALSSASSPDFYERASLPSPSPPYIPPPLGTPGFDLRRTGQYAYHMWHHLLAERIDLATDGELTSESQLDPEDTLRRDSGFNWVAREYLSKDLVARWRQWKLAKEEEFSEGFPLKLQV